MTDAPLTRETLRRALEAIKAAPYREPIILCPICARTLPDQGADTIRGHLAEYHDVHDDV